MAVRGECRGAGANRPHAAALALLHEPCHLLTGALPACPPALQVPVACVLGFPLKLGVQGFYGGMICGPLIQTVAYLFLILRLRWSHEAHLARQRLAAAAAPL